jgi:hypothetical protein
MRVLGLGAAALCACALLLSIWQGEWRSLRGSPMIAVPLRMAEVHDVQRPWRLEEAAPPVPARPAFAAVYGPNAVRQDFRAPADHLNQLAVWMAGPLGQMVTLTLEERASGAQYVAQPEILDPSGQAYKLTFPPFAQSKGKLYMLVISAPDATAERAVSLRIAPGDRVGGMVYLNLYPVDGNLDFAAYHRGAPGRWWLDVLWARLVPYAYRSRIEQYKPDWVGERTFGWLVVGGLLLSSLAIVAGAARRATIFLAACALAVVTLGLGSASIWQRLGSSSAIEMSPGEGSAPDLASRPHAAYDLLMNWGDTTADLTRRHHRDKASAEMAASTHAVRPGVRLDADYPLAWRLRLLPGSTFRATTVPLSESGQFELWVSADGTRTNIFQQDAQGLEKQIEADLRPYAGRQVKLELLCPQGEGLWVAPQILTDGAWLLPHPLPPLTPGEIWDTDAPRLGDSIRLRGYMMDAADYRPGDVVLVGLYWHAAAPADKDYTVFVHLLDEAGSYVAGQDGRPVGGSFPTTLWVPEYTVMDAHTLSLPADVPSGSYHLGVGLYELETMERLPAFDAHGTRLENDIVRIEPPIQIVSP